MTLDMQATERTRTRYERIAPRYDFMEQFLERRAKIWRKQLWSQVRGPKVLEAGVGTGKNLEYYPSGLSITAIDITPGMLNRARRRALALGVAVDLRLGDVQSLQVPDNTFDDAAATFVFCSVPDPVLGLTELLRVVKPGGHLHLLEHTRSANPVIGALMDLLNPFTVRIMGANINRRTVDNVQRSGWKLERVKEVGMNGIVKLITATKTVKSGTS